MTDKVVPAVAGQLGSRRSLCDVLPRPGGPPLPGRHRGLPLHRRRCLHSARSTDLRAADSEVRERGPGLRRPPRAATRRRGVRRGPAGRPRPGLEAGHPPRHGRLVGPRGRAGPLRRSPLPARTPPLLRRTDPERALDLGRAAVAQRDGRGRGRVAPPDSSRAPGSCWSGCATSGPAPGGGWSTPSGDPRRRGSPWPGRRRPVAVLAHRRRAQRARRPPGQRHRRRRRRAGWTVELYAADHRRRQAAERVVEVPARGGTTVSAASPVRRVPGPDLRLPVRPPTLRVGDGRARRRGRRRPSWPPGDLPARGPGRPVQSEIGLQASSNPPMTRHGPCPSRPGASPSSSRSTCPGFGPDDSWFHLEPGGSLVTDLYPEPVRAGPAPDGSGPGAQLGRGRPRLALASRFARRERSPLGRGRGRGPTHGGAADGPRPGRARAERSAIARPAGRGRPAGMAILDHEFQLAAAGGAGCRRTGRRRPARTRPVRCPGPAPRAPPPAVRRRRRPGPGRPARAADHRAPLNNPNTPPAGPDRSTASTWP